MTAMHDKVRALGREFTPEQMQGSMALFAPLLPAIDEAKVHRDLSYGPDPRHRLDLFGADPGGAPRPVVVYIHGGGFVAGDKGGPDKPFYSNIGAWAARQGWIGVTATYRLAPANPWPAGAEDIARMVAWLKAEVAAYGGDPNRIVLSGQSAGAAHVAAYLGSAPFSDAARSSLAGAAMLSGIYDVAAADRNPFQSAYYGDDAAQFERQSSIAGVAATTVPCLFTVAELDPPDFQKQAALMASRWVAAKGVWPVFHRLEGQNHLSPALQIGSSADDVGPLLARFIVDVTRARS